MAQIAAAQADLMGKVLKAMKAYKKAKKTMKAMRKDMKSMKNAMDEMKRGMKNVSKAEFHAMQHNELIEAACFACNELHWINVEGLCLGCHGAKYEMSESA